MSIWEGVNRDFFSYLLIDLMKIWDGTKLLVLCSLKENTLDLTATSNSEHYSVDTNDNEDQNYQLSTTNDANKYPFTNGCSA